MGFDPSHPEQEQIDALTRELCNLVPGNDPIWNYMAARMKILGQARAGVSENSASACRVILERAESNSVSTG